jgi:[ribosomal protein S18]-alanine N-acetyltransferase
MSAELQQFAEIGAPRIRAMQEGDLTQVAAIEGSAYEYPWNIGIFRDCLRAGYGCWVLERADEVLGYGVLSVAADEAHVLNVCVRPDVQGRGYGRQLMRRLTDLARWHHVRRLFLEVRPSNPNAIALYASLGFAEIGRRPNYYPAAGGREDALVMARELIGTTDEGGVGR